MNCAEVQLQVHWLAPDTPLPQAIAKHLEECPICQQQLGELHALRELCADEPFASLQVDDAEIPSVEAAYTALQARLKMRHTHSPPMQPAASSAIASVPSKSWWDWLSLGWHRSFALAIPSLILCLAFWSLLQWPRPLGSSPSALPAPVKSPMWTGKGIVPPIIELLWASPSSNQRGYTIPRLAAPQQVLYPGDFLQLRYTLPQRIQIMVLSVNQRGELFVFYPFQGRHSVPLEAGAGTIPPQGAWELDDFLGAERLFVFVNNTPFSLAELQQKHTQEPGPSAIPACQKWMDTWWCRSFSLLKQKRPAP